MARVIVTGANGFVGNHLVPELSSHGYEIIGVGGPIAKSATPRNVAQYIECDLTDPDQVGNIDFSDVDGVVHLAGLAIVSQSYDNPLEFVTKNIGMQVNLFEEAIKQSCKPKFLIISSGTLYDPKAALPLDEQSPALPSSPYAVSKLGQEQMAWYYSMRGFEVVVARPFNHIGPGQSLGLMVTDFVKQVIDIEHGAADKLLVGNLEAKRDFTDVRDIVRAYRLILEKGRTGETYNICSGTSRSGQEVLELILEKAGSNATVEQDPARMRPSDTPDIYGSHEKLTADTGWQPEIPLETTIADIIADWRSRE